LGVILLKSEAMVDGEYFRNMTLTVIKEFCTYSVI